MSSPSPISPPSPASRTWAKAALVAALAAAGALASCAGPLDDPGRFVYLFDAGQDSGADAGASDSGLDAGAPDAGESDAGDAGDTDAGLTDAGPSDAGPIDAGHPDAGFDAGCDPVKAFFGTTCATATCHDADTQQANLDLQSPGLPGRLIGQHASGGPGLIIDPSQPDSSVIYTKVTSDPPFNFQMPLGLDPLTPDQVACIRAWVHEAVGH
jgi:hypothetical protein